MSDYAEFQVFEGDEFYAEASGPREAAWREALNYASQVEMARIDEVTRRGIPTPWNEVPPSAGGPYAVSLQGALTELVEAFEAPPAPTPDDPGCRGNIHRYRDAMAAARALLAESTERSASAQPDREAGNTSTPGPATRDQGSADFQRTPHGSEGSASPLHHRPCREATEGEGRLSPNAVTAVPGLSPDRPPHIIKSPLPGVLRDVVVPEIIDNTGNGCHAVGHLDATDTAAILKGARAALVRYGAPDGEPYLEVLDLAVQRCHSQGLLQPDDPPNPDRAVRRYGIDYTD